MRRLRRILVDVALAVVYYCCSSCSHHGGVAGDAALSCGAVEHISITMTAMMMMSAAVKLDVCMDGY